MRRLLIVISILLLVGCAGPAKVAPVSSVPTIDGARKDVKSAAATMPVLAASLRTEAESIDAKAGPGVISHTNVVRYVAEQLESIVKTLDGAVAALFKAVEQAKVQEKAAIDWKKSSDSWEAKYNDGFRKSLQFGALICVFLGVACLGFGIWQFSPTLIGLGVAFFVAATSLYLIADYWKWIVFGVGGTTLCLVGYLVWKKVDVGRFFKAFGVVVKGVEVQPAVKESILAEAQSRGLETLVREKVRQVKSLVGIKKPS